MPMNKRITFPPLLRSFFLWTFSVILTLLCVAYQDRTGPTYPLEGDVQTRGGTIHFKFLRSETIGHTLTVMLAEPLPEGISAFVRYRRFKSHDDWSSLPFEPGTFQFSRRGFHETVGGLGARLPGLTERAGKYEYFVYVDTGDGKKISVTGENPVYARYKGEVPTWVLIIHIVVIFASMTFALRTVIEALANGTFTWMLRTTVLCLLLGAFVLGPLVQRYAFGVWWSGLPFGYDWTDNKVLVELGAWIYALAMNRDNRRDRRSVYLAGILTLIVYLIPHSMFGSEFDYTKGRGIGAE